MATKKEKEESRGTVRTSWDGSSGSTSPRDGWVLPRRGEAEADLPGGVRVRIVIEVEEGKARARSLTVSTESPHGVGWKALSQIPARDIVAVAVRDGLRKAITYDDGTTLGLLLPKKEDADEVRQVVQAAVGYRPRLEGFRVIAGGERR